MNFIYKNSEIFCKLFRVKPRMNLEKLVKLKKLLTVFCNYNQKVKKKRKLNLNFRMHFKLILNKSQ